MRPNIAMENERLARCRWGRLSRDNISQLCGLSDEYGFSISLGHLTIVNGRWYVTHAGLLRIARRNHCSGIHTKVVAELSAPRAGFWVVKATVFTTPYSKGFVGYGDADPSNVSSVVRGAELRVAETRAVNRALRKAYGIGVCSIEELGGGPKGGTSNLISALAGPSTHGPARLRDRLLLLIRQHQLDEHRVKHYAIHFCGTAKLREAGRQQVESLVNHLTMLAAQGRDQLLAELNSVCSEAKCPPAAANSASQVENGEEG